MSIVCATTLGTDEQQANQAAAALALLLGDELHLVHVIDELGAELVLADEHDTLYEPHGRRLRSEADALGRLGIQIEPELAAGAWHVVLPRIAMLHRARLIVLAPHPGVLRKRPSSWRAARIVRAAPIPVLLVQDADGLLRWARGHSPLRVLVALGRSPGSQAALRWLSELPRGGPCEALLAHVSQARSQKSPPDSRAEETRAHPYRIPPPPSREAPLGGVEALRDELCRLGVKVTETSVQDTRALSDLAQREAIDLVVVSRDLRQGRVWPRWAWHSLFRSAVPGVVCVPPDYVPSTVARARPAGLLARLARQHARRGQRRRRGSQAPPARLAWHASS